MENYHGKPEILTAYNKDGPYELILKSQNKKIWSCKTNITEINDLIDKETNQLYKSITYDEVDFSLLDIRIDNVKMRITINIGSLFQSDSRVDTLLG